ncbi:MAG: hypothetical protein QF575_08335, partial [Acidimicrobiales bacterium]|nr:hypothetical protein [Acidimicrobiales bacterium]
MSATGLRWLRAVVAVGVLASVTSLATGATPPPAQAWSSSDGSYVAFGSNHNGHLRDVHVDSSGNIYTCGSLRGDGDVDPNYYDGVSTTESPDGKHSSLVTKLDSSGSLVWSSLMNADSDDYLENCAVDSSGNVYVAGRFKGAMDFDDDGTTEVTALDDADGGSDAFVAKLDSSGAVVWWKVVGNTSDVSSQLDTALGYGVGVDSSGNVYFGGHFTGTIDIDPGATTTAVTSTTTASKYDAFLVKLDSSGDTVWTRHWGGPHNDYLHDIAVDASGNVVAVGRHRNGAGDVNYHPIAGGCTSSCGETLVTGYGGWDAYISKIGADGSLAWAGFVGSAFNESLNAVTTDGSGNVYATGDYRASATGDFDPGSGSSITLPTGGGEDAFVIKVASDGNGVWAKAFETTSGSGGDAGEGIAVDASGNVYVTGIFDEDDTVDFDPGSGTTAFTADDTDDVFGVKLDSSGNLVWARQFESVGTYNPEGNAVAVDGSGNVYFAGDFIGHMDFDPGSGEAWWFARTAMSRWDGYVVKLDSSGELGDGNSAWVENAPSGWDVVHGPVDGTDLEGWLSEVVLATPLCPSGKWEFDHISNLGHRLYVVEDSALAASGLGLGDYIWETYSTYSATVPDYNQLWLGNLNDHDGNTSMLTQTFQVLGWEQSSTVTNPVSYYVHESSGILQWEEDGVATGADTEEAPHGGLVPSGYSVYFALANKDYESRSFSTLESMAATGCVGGVTLSETTASATEGGSTDSFTAVLDYHPTSDVVVTVTSSDTDEATVSPATLTFTTADWSTPQTVTVTAVDDNVDDGNQSASLTVAVVDASSADEYDDVADQVVSVTAVDDDTVGFTLSTTTASVTEAGSTDTFTVRLNTQPTGTVVLTVASDDTGEATVSPSTLSFGLFDWQTPQTVTVTGVDDDLDDGNQASTATVAVDAASTGDSLYDALASQDVDVTTVDDDTAGFTLSTTTASVTEAGSTDTFTVVLDSEPTGTVVLTVASDDTGEATVSPATLTFTTGNWDTAQTVTVTGVDDDLDDGNQASTATVAVNTSSTADSGYDALADRDVDVTTSDDDTAGFTLSGTTITVTEAGSNETFTVVLDSEPTGNVVFGVTASDTREATVSPATLTFTSANWDTAQAVTVTGVDDSIADGSQASTATISVNTSSTADSGYDALADQDVDVTTSDDDTPGVSVSQSGGSTSVAESGTTDSFTVELTTQPVSDVVISVSSADTGEVTVSPATLTFTSANWDTPQTVTATGVDDTDVDGTIDVDVTVAVMAASSDDAYDGVADQVVAATNEDDDVKVQETTTTTTTTTTSTTSTTTTAPTTTSTTTAAPTTTTVAPTTTATTSTTTTAAPTTAAPTTTATPSTTTIPPSVTTSEPPPPETTTTTTTKPPPPTTTTIPPTTTEPPTDEDSDGDGLTDD